MRKCLVFVIFTLWLVGCAAADSPEPAFLPTPRMIVPESTQPSAEADRALPQSPTASPTKPVAIPSSGATMTLPQSNDPALNAQLIQAAEAGDTSAVRWLLEQGAEINMQDERGRTPVMVATHGNHVEIVRTLIAAGADINIRDNRLDNPFLYAGAEGLQDIIKLAIDAGADTRLTNRFGGTALIPAAERGHVEVVQELLTRTDVDVNHVNNLGWTALLEAIILGEGGERHTRWSGCWWKPARM